MIASRDVPRITDPVAASAAPELAILSVLGHPDVDVAEAAIAAILRLPEPRQELYLDVILGAIPDPVRRLVEVHMYKHEYQSDFARKYFAQGRQEGTLLAVLAVAQAKLGDLSEDLQARIRAVASDAQLTEILVALSGAPDATAARAVLDRFAPAAPA